MSRKKKCQVSIIGIFKPGLVGIDTRTSESIDPAHLAESIGINENHTVKAKITIEVVEGPCEQCGELATGHQLCQKCGKLVCDKCAKTDSGGRYCPKCFAQIQSLSKLI
ncbi:MAG TPA: hypothetical protein VMT42_07815 [candidate division Zixibacteria bacterium]|nr:hypothetical protein [candidate division Zixibacteria bacterium]